MHAKCTVLYTMLTAGENEMAKKTLTIEQKKADIDLYIIIAITVLVLMIYMAFQAPISAFAKNPEVHVLIRTLVMAGFEFGVAGLGMTTVMLLRKEGFRSYGLKKEGALKAIVFSLLMGIPHILFLILTGSFKGYLPFQAVWMTRDVLAGGFPVNVIGMIIIAVVWGFFEGFNYAVISDKINMRYPSRNRWLNWGAIVCAVACILIHGAIGVTPENIIETATIFMLIYGMLMVKAFTGNAWGIVVLFVFLWNAF